MNSFFNKYFNKYVISIVLTSIIPLLVSLFLILTIIRDNLDRQQFSDMVQCASTIENNLETRIDELIYAKQNLRTLLVSMNRFHFAKGSYKYSDLTQFELTRNNLTNMQTLYNIGRIRVYSETIPYAPDGDGIYLFPLQSFELQSDILPEQLNDNTSKWLTYITANENNLDWELRVYKQDYVCIYDGIFDVNENLIAVSMMYCTVDSFLDCASFSSNAQIAISSSDGVPVCANVDSETAKSLFDHSVPVGSVLRDGNRLIARYDVPNINWILTVSIPFTEQVNILNSFGGSYIVLLLITFIISILVGILISRLQLRKLTAYYNTVKEIDYTVPDSIASLPERLDEKLSSIRNPDEVDFIMRSFSLLVRDNIRLIENINKHNLEIEKYKFKVLQEQINPHFLYNALETLRLCIQLGRTESAVKSLDSLSRFYRIALSKGREIISVREELDMITNYLEIENIGYSNTIQWTLDVDEDCLDIPIPKLTLQPLVENSILHGCSSSGILKLSIAIHCQSNILEMIISDNGVGIPEDVLREIQNGLSNDTMQKSKKGFGLRNVNQRIQLLYGNEFRLIINSVPGRTENIVRIPIE